MLVDGRAQVRSDVCRLMAELKSESDVCRLTAKLKSEAMYVG